MRTIDFYEYDQTVEATNEMQNNTGITTSVIIPVYNDPEGLSTTINSLLEQNAGGFEIIIADNGSTDTTRELAKQYALKENIIHVIEDEIQGSYAARNAGIKAAQGDILCFIDADMWIDSDWVGMVQTHIIEKDIDYLGCNVEIVVEEKTIFAKYNEYNGFPVKKYTQKRNFSPTCCLVVRRTVVNDVGNFDERLVSSGDVEFGKRVHKAGYKQGYAPEIVMYHPARETFTSFAKKHYRIGQGRVQRARYHPKLFDITRHPCHPFNFLPLPPTVVFSSYPTESIKQFAGMYFVASIAKVAKSVGQTLEWALPTQ